MEKRKNQIIRTAIRDFSLYGIQDVALYEIAFNAGISMSQILEVYPQKALLLDDIYRFIPSSINFYDPTSEEILDLLKVESAEAILTRFGTVAYRSEDMLQDSITRLICMEQYHCARSRDLVLEYHMKRPIEVLVRTLDILKTQNCIPECDSRIIAEMWHRNALVYENKWIHGVADWEGYQTMNQFFIALILRGTSPAVSGWYAGGLPTVDIDWSSRDGRLKMQALELLSANGYHHVTLADIAKYSDFSEQEIIKVYHDKKGLLRTIAQELSGGLLQYDDAFVQTIIQKYSLEQIIAMIAGLHLPQRNRMADLLCQVLFRDQFFSEDLKELFLDILQISCEAVAALLDASIHRKKISFCDSRKIANVLIYTLCSLAMAETAFPYELREDNQTFRVQAASILLGLIHFGYQR